MSTTKKSIIAVLLLALVVAGSLLFLQTEKNKQLHCETILNSYLLLSSETSDAFNGPEANMYAQNAYQACNTHTFEKIEDCDDYDAGRKEDCTIAYGAQADSIEDCKNDSECEFSFAASHTDDCDQYSGSPTVLKNICLYSKSQETNDISYCNRIDIVSMTNYACITDGQACFFNKNKCIWGLSDRTNNISYCDLMTETPEKDLCYFSNALKQKNTNICSNITQTKSWESLCKEIVSSNGDHEALKEGILNYLSR